MKNEAKLKVVIAGIRVKMERGEELETILEGYVKLSDEEKAYIRNNIEA